jgi:Zn-dependent protease
MEWTPEWLVGIGMLGIAALYLPMLRRERPVVAATPEGLVVGERTLPWRAVQRLGLAAGDGGAELRIATTHGVVHVRDDQLLHRIDDVARTIVREAALIAVTPDRARAPRDLPGSMRSVYDEWRQDPHGFAVAMRAAGEARDAGRASGAPRPARAPTFGGLGRRREPATEASKKAAVGIATLLALISSFGKAIVSGLGWVFDALNLCFLLPTAVTMAVSIWAYAQLWGWWFAAGLVGLLFVHELGHAGVMAAKGLRTSPIVFLPGLGAFIALKDQFLDARVEAETGWGGPALGALGTGACYLVWALTGHDFWLNLTFVGCVINLLNLLPVSPLDGGRIVTAISPWLWLPGLLAAGALGYLMRNPLLALIATLGLVRAVREVQARLRGQDRAYFDVLPADRMRIAGAYFGLAAGLGWLTHHVFVLSRPLA